MQVVDLLIFISYMAAMLYVGFFFLRKNKTIEDYFVGGRQMNSLYIGLSVVTTDVGGGFSIGLGRLCFIMELSGSWLLFTGLTGAWLNGVFLIPYVLRLTKGRGFFSFPQFLGSVYDNRVAHYSQVLFRQ